jgi:hypothetical protein
MYMRIPYSKFSREANPIQPCEQEPSTNQHDPKSQIAAQSSNVVTEYKKSVSPPLRMGAAAPPVELVVGTAGAVLKERFEGLMDVIVVKVEGEELEDEKNEVERLLEEAVSNVLVVVVVLDWTVETLLIGIEGSSGSVMIPTEADGPESVSVSSI